MNMHSPIIFLFSLLVYFEPWNRYLFLFMAPLFSNGIMDPGNPHSFGPQISWTRRLNLQYHGVHKTEWNLLLALGSIVTSLLEKRPWGPRGQ
jgi:hypothetical protein